MVCFVDPSYMDDEALVDLLEDLMFFAAVLVPPRKMYRVELEEVDPWFGGSVKYTFEVYEYDRWAFIIEMHEHPFIFVAFKDEDEQLDTKALVEWLSSKFERVRNVKVESVKGWHYAVPGRPWRA